MRALKNENAKTTTHSTADRKGWEGKNHFSSDLKNLIANVSNGRESPDRTEKSNSILFYQKIPLGG